MSHSLTGRRIAFLATDGVEQSELFQPWEALQQAGAKRVRRGQTHRPGGLNGR
jgi:protease I